VIQQISTPWNTHHLNLLMETTNKKKKKHTPGTSAPTMILPIDTSLKPVRIASAGLITISPFALLSATHFSTLSSRSLRSGLSVHLADSTLASVSKPKATGNVMVGSVCAREVNVAKDSESSGVGL
jgi:hypothetical protein